MGKGGLEEPPGPPGTPGVVLSPPNRISTAFTSSKDAHVVVPGSSSPGLGLCCGL